MKHATLTDFIEHEILPTLGEFADDYDVDGIADAVTEYNGGYGFKPEYRPDETGANEAYWDVVKAHDTAGND